MEVSFACTTCPKCKKFVITVYGQEWADVQYICICGTAFVFRKSEDVEE